MIYHHSETERLISGERCQNTTVLLSTALAGEVKSRAALEMSGAVKKHKGAERKGQGRTASCV